MKALVGGRVMTIGGPTLEVGTVFFDGPTIVGVEEGTEVPSDAEIIDVKRKVVLPGLVDAHSHVGIWGDGNGWAGNELNETSDPLTPEVRAIDGINPQDIAFEDVRGAGITTILVGPGSANVIGGEFVALKTVGSVVDEMVILNPAGLKMAFGENPRKVYGDRNLAPKTRMGVPALARKMFMKGREYLEKRTGDGGTRAPTYDYQLEAIGRALQREEKVRMHAHRADDIVTAVRLGKEFDLDITIEHATEGYLVADFLADNAIPCSVGPLHISRLKYEMGGLCTANPGILARAGVKVAIHSDTTSASQFLAIAAGLACREGMPEDAALRSITLTAAELVGVADRVGSLEKGKDADIAVFSGHPFETMTVAELVFVDGRLIYRRD